MSQNVPVLRVNVVRLKPRPVADDVNLCLAHTASAWAELASGSVSANMSLAELDWSSILTTSPVPSTVRSIFETGIVENSFTLLLILDLAQNNTVIALCSSRSWLQAKRQSPS